MPPPGQWQVTCTALESFRASFDLHMGGGEHPAAPAGRGVGAVIRSHGGPGLLADGLCCRSFIYKLQLFLLFDLF